MARTLVCKVSILNRLGEPVLEKGKKYDLWISPISSHDCVFKIIPHFNYKTLPMAAGADTVKRAFGVDEIEESFGWRQLMCVRDDVNIRKIERDEEDIL